MTHRTRLEVELDIRRTKASLSRMKATLRVLGQKGLPDDESKIHFLESDLRLFRDEWTNAAMREAKQPTHAETMRLRSAVGYLETGSTK